MIVEYSILIIIISLSFTQGIQSKAQTIKNDHSNSLPLDKAYLIVRNTNCSESVILSGNKIICEDCDLEKIAIVASNHNSTVIIDTKYAYNFEVRSWSSNISSLCQIASYKFAEHGTYVFDITETMTNTSICTIEQIGNPSYYWAPAIVGIVAFILYAVVVQIWQHIYNKRYCNFRRTNIPHQRLIDDNLVITSTSSVTNTQRQIVNESNENIIDGNISNNKLSLPLTHLPDNKAHIVRILPKRLRALDTFRGFALMVMIFVNYGGGGYWFFDHSTWNGLTLADLVFPWFTWMMGVSIVLSQRSLQSKNIRKRSILLKICRRTIILFVLGFTGQDGITAMKNLRIFGVLQRLATCYFFTAIIVLIFEKKDNGRNTKQRNIENNVDQPLYIELFKNVFQFWIQWLFVILIITAWILITFLLPVPNCPTGYLGPGGKHDHGKYWNCTGGAAGYIDRTVLGNSHLYGEPTCKEIYHTKVPHDPEGIMGILTGILLCYLGVQAGHIFVHSTSVRRICGQWIMWGIICGCFGLGLSHGGHSNSWIPINKNLWSLTFVFTLASLAFINLTILYLLVDVRQWFTGAPFFWLGMNSIAIYICHDRFSACFPVQFEVNNTHAEQLAMHLYGSFFWSIVAGVMYYKKVFISI